MENDIATPGPACANTRANVRNRTLNIMISFWTDLLIVSGGIQCGRHSGQLVVSREVDLKPTGRVKIGVSPSRFKCVGGYARRIEISRHRYSELIAQDFFILLRGCEQTFFSSVFCSGDEAHAAESDSSFGSSARANAILREMRLRRRLVKATPRFIVTEPMSVEREAICLFPLAVLATKHYTIRIFSNDPERLAALRLFVRSIEQ